MSDDFKRYVAGFLFRRDEVLLVRKNRPKWQVGMMNAVGGQVDTAIDEPLMVAMVREFAEETTNRLMGWEMFCTEIGPGYAVHFFRLRVGDDSTIAVPAKNDVGEELEWCRVDDIKYPVIGNLHWLLPMALDPRTLDVTVRTNGDIRRIVTW